MSVKKKVYFSLQDEQMQTPPIAQDPLKEIQTSLESYQTELQQQLQVGAEFLESFRPDTLLRSESVTGVVADRFKLFSSDEWDDCMWLALSEYIESKKGKGACHAWLHARLRGLTHGSCHLVWDEDATVDAVWMVLRHVRITDATIAVCEKILYALQQQDIYTNSGDKETNFNWDKAARSFFATLDSDCYWSNHPII